MLGRTDGQTNRRTNHTEGTNQTVRRNQTGWIYLRTDTKDRRTNWMDRQTDERKTWQTDWRNRRTGKKDCADGQKDWMDGWINRRDGQTKRTRQRNKRIGWTDRCTKPMEWKKWTRGQMDRTHGQTKRIKGPDRRTDWRIGQLLNSAFVWSQLLCRSPRFILSSVSFNNC